MSQPSRFPGRLREQLNSPLVKALLRVGSEVSASQATRVGVLEILGLEGNRARVVQTRLLPFRRTALLMAAMVISAAAVAIPLTQRMMVSDVPELPQDSATVEQSVRDVGPRLGATPEVTVSSPTPDPVQQPASVAKPTRVTEEPTSVRAVAPPTGRNVLAAELAALDAARGRLSAGEPKAALAALDAYQRDFPRPRLALEAEVLRIDALDRSGQTDVAKKRAAAFVQNHPKGVLTGRVRRYLEQ